MKEKGIYSQQYHFRFFDRDISWLTFNERVLKEASNELVPIMERVRFLSIYSSNLDEFYRVRMPTLLALDRLRKDGENLEKVNAIILRQLQTFGHLIKSEILPELKRNEIDLVYDEPLPEFLHEQLTDFFLYHVSGYIQLVEVSKHHKFFPENNKLYCAVRVEEGDRSDFYIVNIPSDSLPRFFVSRADGRRCIVFLDDVVKHCLPLVFSTTRLLSHNFKITRDAELDLEDEFKGNLARKIERKIQHRDFGLATRVLYEPGFDPQMLDLLKTRLNLYGACFVEGGRYHNLKDLSTLPVHDAAFHYRPMESISVEFPHHSLFEDIGLRDRLLHTPYHSYDTVVRFFNEASIDPKVTSIQVTLYRVARDSRIVNALMSAARNGKEVVVFVELKARFDEANNLKWSKRMKEAGVKIIESIPGLKVHAKIALVKRRTSEGLGLYGLLSTGNFNESTARFYTDHILFTADKNILVEMDSLFKILKRKKLKRARAISYDFKHLLVGQFNLQHRFLELIEREISLARQGLPSYINIKINNLEDKVLITKLYEASNAGVKINLIIRGICCLVPGVEGQSKNIIVRRIVDRFLEHGRLFIFGNNGEAEVYMGSADWMNRNLYRRIEVCFPVYSSSLRDELLQIFDIQRRDNVKAVDLNSDCANVPVQIGDSSESVRSQSDIMKFLKTLG